MAEGFIDFDSEKLDLDPSFFSHQFTDNFFKTDFAQFEGPERAYRAETFINMEESPETRAMDALSSDSYSSTNYSSKYSPDNVDNSSVDRKYEDDTMKASKLPPIMRKGIQKLYDPILDNNVVYKYEDDPSEYKKARKRVQNRESASRVRNKKKNRTEELEIELSAFKRENADLKVKNAALRAENNLLKQQTSFLEKMVMKAGQQPAMTNNPYNEQNYEECLLPLVNKAEDKTTSKNYGHFRAAPPHTFKKHAVLLGMFTIMICTYGMISQNDDGSAQLFYPNNLNDFKNSFSMGVKSVNVANGRYPNGHNLDLDQSLSALLKANQEYNSLKSMVKLFFTTAYMIYFVYVLLITNWKYLFRVKSNKTM